MVCVVVVVVVVGLFGKCRQCRKFTGFFLYRVDCFVFVFFERKKNQKKNTIS